jgi:DNA-binding MarR family transcriptional regulator
MATCGGTASAATGDGPGLTGAADMRLPYRAGYTKAPLVVMKATLASAVNPPPRPERVQYLLRRVWLAIQQQLDERLQAAGYDDLRSAHGAVFQAIDQAGSRVTDMAVAAQMSAQAMGQLVNDLQRKGYVERAPDPSDGRAKLVVLTDRGWRAIAVAREVLAEMEAAWSVHLGPRRAEAFRAALADIVDLLDHEA